MFIKARLDFSGTAYIMGEERRQVYTGSYNVDGVQLEKCQNDVA